MLQRTLGKIKTPISAIGFGGGSISGEGGGYGFGAISETDAIDLLNASLDRGINLFDTAPIYGFGVSEQRLGKAFKGKRDRAFIVSKSGVTWHPDKTVYQSNDPLVTQKMLEQSLRDLETDYIDLYMIHWPDQQVDIRKPMEVLARAKEAGKVKHLGLCNSNAEDINKAGEIHRVEVLQNEYNLFSRDYVEREIFPIVEREGMGFMSYGTLDKGILTGRVNKDRTFDEHDARSKASWWKNADRSWKYEAMDQINPLLDDEKHTGLQLALGFVLQSRHVGTALCGMRNMDQLETAIEALNHLPGPKILARIVEISEKEAAKAKEGS